jgi:hypothetical protein
MNKVDSFSISQERIFKTGSEQEVNNCDLNFCCDIPFGGRQSKCKGLHYLYGMYSCVPNVCR